MLNDKDFSAMTALLPFWEHVSEPLAASVRTHSYVRDFCAGEKVSDVSSSNIGLVAVLSGRIRVSLVSANAREVTISVCKRGGVIYVSGNPSPHVLNSYEIESEVDSRTVIIQASDCEALLRSDCRIENTVLRAVLGQFNRIIFDMQNFLFQDLDQRLAGHLLFEHRQQGSFSLVTTHQRIANSIASSREVVSRMLKQWERLGIVKLSRGCVKICDLNVLIQLSGE
ncbi:MAG: Crp/Fnr family transcriptional regulator [Lachnospiraceae bacterium]|nr:Crp/Fnr family transcriptional regulator [Lachnospiraceae bacterium]